MNDWKHLMPFRPNYESYEVAAWSVAMLTTIGVGSYLSMPTAATFSTLAIQGVFALKVLPNAIKISLAQKQLKTIPTPTFVDALTVVKEMIKQPNTTLLGKGFTWKHEHGQRAFDILKTGAADRFLPDNDKSMGYGWIHQLGSKEKWIGIPDEMLTLHSTVTGTTGSGKTTFYKLMILQAAIKKIPIIFVDPKNDVEIAEFMHECMRLTNRLNDNYYLSIAHLHKSNSISPISNYTNSTEVANRIISVIQKSDNTTDPFLSFATMALTTVIQLMDYLKIKPTLVNIKSQLGTDLSYFADLITKSIDKLGNELFPDVYENIIEKRKQHLSLDDSSYDHIANARIRINFYTNDIAPTKEYPFIKSGIDLMEHNREHFQKMILNALPILMMLTSDGLDEILSPSVENVSTDRVSVSVKDIINNNGMLYLGLNGLADGEKGRAVGSIFLSDITAVAADIYNYERPRGEKKHDTIILIDEAAEVINDQVIRLLNKGRGAGYNLYIASQSASDYVATLGSEAKKEQVNVNANHNLSLRTINPLGQKEISEKIPTVNYKYIQRGHGTSSGADPELVTGNIGERIVEVEGELFPSQLLGNLPNLEFLGLVQAGRLIKGKIPFVSLPKNEKDINALIEKIKEYQVLKGIA